MASAKPLNDPQDPGAPISTSTPLADVAERTLGARPALYSDHIQLGVDGLEDQETVRTSLIDNWIDA